jgi:hypothetical protein
MAAWLRSEPTQEIDDSGFDQLWLSAVDTAGGLSAEDFEALLGDVKPSTRSVRPTL